MGGSSGHSARLPSTSTFTSLRCAAMVRGTGMGVRGCCAWAPGAAGCGSCADRKEASIRLLAITVRIMGMGTTGSKARIGAPGRAATGQSQRIRPRGPITARGRPTNALAG